MMNKVPNTKNWRATETTSNFAGEGHKLTVVGEVQLGNTNETPDLKEAPSQGINPKILLLELSVTAEGAGNTVVKWESVKFEHAITSRQYDSVDIFTASEKVSSADVELIPS